MDSGYSKLVRRIQCLCKRIEDLEVLVGDLEGGSELPLFTEGSVLFADTDGSITEDNAKFFWNDTTNALLIGTNIQTSASNKLEVLGRVLLSNGSTEGGAANNSSVVLINPRFDTLGGAPTALHVNITDTLSDAGAKLINAQVGSVDMFTVRKDGRITTAETLAFTNALTNNTTPTGFLTLSSPTLGTAQYSTVAQMQTALGIGAGALTAGYVAFGTGTGITGEAEFFYDTTNNRLGIGTATPSTSLHINAGATAGVITLESDNAAYMSIFRYSNNVTRPRYETYKARGTKAVPLTVQTGDELAAFDFYGHNGSAFLRNATIYTTVKNVSGTDITAQMNFGFGFSGAATDHYQAFSAAGALFTDTTATSKTPTSIVDINRDGLGTTQTTSSGLALTNNTAANLGTPVQISPALRFTGSRWNTTTSLPETVSMVQDILPIQAATGVNPVKWRLMHDYTTPGTFAEVLNVTSWGQQSSLNLKGSKITITSGGQSTINSNYALQIEPGNGALGYGLHVGSTPFTPTARLMVRGDTLTSTAAQGCLDILQTWNTSTNATTAIKLNITNTLSHASSLLMDLQVGGVSQFKVDKAGLVSTRGVALISTGAAATAGTATLVGGTVTVNTTAMTATAILNYNRKTLGGVLGNLTYTQVDNTSFTITSDNALDTSVIVWNIIETY